MFQPRVKRQRAPLNCRLMLISADIHCSEVEKKSPCSHRILIKQLFPHSGLVSKLKVSNRFFLYCCSHNKPPVSGLTKTRSLALTSTSDAQPLIIMIGTTSTAQLFWIINGINTSLWHPFSSDVVTAKTQWKTMVSQDGQLRFLITSVKRLMSDSDFAAFRDEWKKLPHVRLSRFHE